MWIEYQLDEFQNQSVVFLKKKEPYKNNCNNCKEDPMFIRELLVNATLCLIGGVRANSDRIHTLHDRFRETMDKGITNI